jgi:hypothetical protein
LQAVKIFGKKWTKVADAVPTRNPMQVRERWVNMLDPETVRGKPWTAEEDAILIQALEECRNENGSTRSTPTVLLTRHYPCMRRFKHFSLVYDARTLCWLKGFRVTDLSARSLDLGSNV